MGFRGKHAYPMMHYMLSSPEFLQRHMAKDLDIHFGATVNNFTHWLIDLGYVDKVGTSQRGARSYQVVNPTGLITFYSHFRKMKKIDTFQLGNTKDETIEYLSKQGLVFCLTTALDFHMKYVMDPAIYAYLPKDKKNILQDELARQVPGKITVNLYDYDIEDPGLVTSDNKKITSKVRTVVDLYCNNMAFAAEELVKELW